MKDSRTILYKNLGQGVLEESTGLPYVVPEGYFDNLSTIINMKLPKENIAHQDVIKFPALDVPKGYFDDLSSNILASIDSFKNNREDELLSITPVLSEISKEIPYYMPTNYFENFKVPNKESIEEPKVAKFISITNRMVWLRVAIAASVIGILLVGAIVYSNKGKNDENNYASYKNVDIKSSIKKISDEDLEKYLNNDYIASNTEMIILDDGDAPDAPSVEQKVESVSDNDLEQYLQDVATSPTGKKGI
jgi:hypothetical protein